MKPITFDPKKRDLILNDPTRAIDLVIVAWMIERGDYFERRENPTHPWQEFFALPYDGYTCAVIFEEREADLHLITAYRSRALHKYYTDF